MPPKRKSAKSKGKGRAKAADTVPEDVPDETPAPTTSEPVSSEALEEQLPPTAGQIATAVSAIVASILPGSSNPEPSNPSPPSPPVDTEMQDVEEEATGTVVVSEPTPTPSTSSTPAPAKTMEERQAKLEELRSRMRTTAQANRSDLVEEHQKSKISAKELARLERQRKLAALLREKTDRAEGGDGDEDDPERKKNWEWTIEENDAWEKRLKRKKGRSDFQFNDAEDTARKKYKKDLELLKPDLAVYTRQKEAALGLVPGALSKAGSSSSSSALVAASGSGTMSVAQRQAAEDLYRDANTLQYGDNKPSEEAIDRVVGKLNNDLDKRGKFSRKRLNEEEGDITYINEHNKVFNKKIARFYDKYTKEIRDSFERGTAL